MILLNVLEDLVVPFAISGGLHQLFDVFSLENRHDGIALGLELFALFQNLCAACKKLGGYIVIRAGLDDGVNHLGLQQELAVPLNQRLLVVDL